MIRFIASLCVFASLCQSSAAVDNDTSKISVSSVLDAFAASVDAVRSYDVFVTFHKEFLLKAEAVGGGSDNRGAPMRLAYREYKLGESKDEIRVLTREWLAGHKRRFQTTAHGAKGWDHWIEAGVFDGELSAQLNRKTAVSGISSRTPHERPLALFEQNYACLFRDLPHGGSLVELLRSRQGTRIDKGDAQLIEVECPQEGTTYRDFGWRISFDPQRGMLPVKMEHYMHNMDVPYCVTSIEAFRLVAPGVWVPTKGIHVFFEQDGRKSSMATLQVDEMRSQWNTPVSDDVFVLTLPAGTKVIDEVRDLAYVSGQSDSSANIDELVENSSKFVPLAGAKQVSPPKAARHWTWALLAAHGAAIVVFLLLLLRRVRRRTSSGM